METTENFAKKLMNGGSVMFKAIVVGVLILLMLIPINMVKSLINEREENKQTVRADISSKWGEQQELVGPILVLPYKKTIGQTEGADKQQKQFLSYYLPEVLNIDGVMTPENRSRGVYEVLCYQSKMKVRGEFNFPEFDKLGLNAENVDWDDSFVLIGIPNLQGIKNKIDFMWDGKSHEILSSVQSNDIIQNGLTVKIPIDYQNKKDKYSFSFDLTLNGTDGLFFVPIGKQTHITMKSPWKTATFVGDFLPNERTIDNNGFEASWDIFDYNRNYPQMWLGTNNDLGVSKLGVDLLVPIDFYQKSMRSVKYAIMFIVLTFTVFFMIELLSNKRIHPIQYLLVSFALVLFYSLLLALSEHIGFELAYLASAIGIIGMITIYSKSVFKSIKQTIFMGLFLTLLYAFLYVILQLEDMALLLGSLGLFIALGIVMFVSRKVDWYNKSRQINGDIV